MKKTYVIAPYISDTHETLAMYESDDFRISDLTNKVTGVYAKTNSVKNLQNGSEIGIFYGDNHIDYIIFIDHTAKKIEYTNGNIYPILVNGEQCVAKFLGYEDDSNVFEIVGTTKLVFKKRY